jgi:hypothetical protein
MSVETKNNSWKNWLGIVIGFLVVITPYTGFPDFFRKVLFLIFGFGVMVLFWSLASDHSVISKNIEQLKRSEGGKN